jgi:hypothetical protein
MNATLNDNRICIETPKAFAAKTHCVKLRLDARHFFETVAVLLEGGGNYKWAAMMRDIASNFPRYSSSVSAVDETGDPVEYGDWDNLSAEEVASRGHRNAILAMLDDLKEGVTMDDNSPEYAAGLREIRGHLSELFPE